MRSQGWYQVSDLNIHQDKEHRNGNKSWAAGHSWGILSPSVCGTSKWKCLVAS